MVIKEKYELTPQEVAEQLLIEDENEGDLDEVECTGEAPANELNDGVEAYAFMGPRMMPF